jgi:hypothetical protein
MSGTASAGSKRSGHVSRLVARALLALLCMLSALSGPSPVLCLESAGGCAGEQSAIFLPASCHDQAPPRPTGCESCTDVVAPEESLLRANRAGHDLEAPVTTSAPERFLVDAASPGTHTWEPLLFRPDPTPLFVRTTVLLI